MILMHGWASGFNDTDLTLKTVTWKFLRMFLGGLKVGRLKKLAFFNYNSSKLEIRMDDLWQPD